MCVCWYLFCKGCWLCQSEKQKGTIFFLLVFMLPPPAVVKKRKAFSYAIFPPLTYIMLVYVFPFASFSSSFVIILYDFSCYTYIFWGFSLQFFTRICAMSLLIHLNILLSDDYALNTMHFWRISVAKIRIFMYR